MSDFVAGADPEGPDSGDRRLVVTGGSSLEGTVRVGGAKNSVLKLMAAALLAEGTYHFTNVPRITDVALMSNLLRATGCAVSWSESVADPRSEERRVGKEGRSRGAPDHEKKKDNDKQSRAQEVN